MAHPSPNPTKKSTPGRRPKPTPKPATPSTTKLEPETVTAALPGFSRPPEDDPGLRPPPPPSDAAPAGVSGDPAPPEPTPTPESPTSRRFRFGPFRRPRLRLLSGSVDDDTKETLAAGAGLFLAGLGDLLHARFASDHRFGPNDVWRVTAEDHTHIAEPLAQIAARRVPAGLDGDSDGADLIHAAVGIGVYGVKNIRARGQLLRVAQLGAWSEAERADPVGPAAGPDLATGAGVPA